LSLEYFGKPSYLTVSGQLHAEMMACALGKVYTFGPTFRVEGTDSPRHLSEFWMLEPEMAFCDLNDCMDTTEQLLKFSIQRILDQCKEEIDFFAKRVDELLSHRINNTLETKFERITYKEALSILDKAKNNGEQFQFPITYGSDLQREHERYLCDVHFKKPVFVINWPRDLKAFYMRQNSDDQTVAAMDLLVPTVGEIAGGSAREERFDLLAHAMQQRNLLNDNYNWYLDLRKFGTVPHAGFGLGFERFIQYVTGIKNIKDSIPVPRFPGACKY
jgi:asparaginyl-tRNA synthetase